MLLLEGPKYSKHPWLTTGYATEGKAGMVAKDKIVD
jgi:hypothetical protein